jgi:hypothetical protein
VVGRFGGSQFGVERGAPTRADRHHPGVQCAPWRSNPICCESRAVAVMPRGQARTARTARCATARSTTPRCGTATASMGRVRTRGGSA